MAFWVAKAIKIERDQAYKQRDTLKVNIQELKSQIQKERVIRLKEVKQSKDTLKIANDKIKEMNNQISSLQTDLIAKSKKNDEADILLNQKQKELTDFQKQLSDLKIKQSYAKKNLEIAILGLKESLEKSASTFIFLGDYAKALEAYQQLLTLVRENNDLKDKGYIIKNIGDTYLALGGYNRALDYLQQSLEISHVNQDPKLKGYSTASLGNFYLAIGEYKKAIEYLQISLEIAEDIQDNGIKIKSLTSLGSVYIHLKSYPQAIEYLHQSLAIAKQIQERTVEAKTLGYLGVAYNFLGDYNKAKEYHDQSLRISQIIGDRPGVANALINLGITYKFLSDYNPAFDYLQQGLSISIEIKSRPLEGQALSILGDIFWHNNKLIEAENTLKKAINVWESIRSGLSDNYASQMSLLETQINTYHTFRDVLISQNKFDAALEFIERNRSRIFVEQLARRLSNIGHSAINTPQPPTIQDIKRIAEQQNSTLVTYSITQKDFKVKDKIITQESELFIWVIQPRGQINFRRVDLKSLWQQKNTNLADLVVDSYIADPVVNSHDSTDIIVRGINVINVEPKLAHTFFIAGVPSVVASLWAVPDESTADLMIEFYKNLQHTDDKAQALRQATLTVMKKSPEPLNWGAFMLIGEAK